MSDNPEALLPCPFCGGAPKMIDREDGPLIFGAFAGCDACDVHTPVKTTAAEARAAWNTRAALAQQAATPTDAVKVFEEAMLQSWRMIDPLCPAGQPGSYARGQDAGIAAALKTVRENFERLVAQQAATPAPAGWKLVPVEPTDEMVRASVESLEGPVNDEWMTENMLRRLGNESRDAYRAMLAAAPATPAAPERDRPSADWYRRKMAASDDAPAVIGGQPLHVEAITVLEGHARALDQMSRPVPNAVTEHSAAENARKAEAIRAAIAVLLGSPATPAAVQDECSATGRSCSYGPHGPKGERQCEYCGDTPATPAAQPAETYRAALERIAAIEDQMYGGDWDEIEEARQIARAALEGR